MFFPQTMCCSFYDIDMAFQIESVHMDEVVVIAPEVKGDARGFFMETFRADEFKKLGLPTEFVQDNHSKSSKGVLRGLHFQWDPPMGKLMRVTNGAAFLVAVDIRKGSPTYRKWEAFTLSEHNHLQLYIPAGFLHGFLALTKDVIFAYKHSALYNPGREFSVRWDDPTFAIPWPLVGDPKISARDQAAPLFDPS